MLALPITKTAAFEFSAPSQLSYDSAAEVNAATVKKGNRNKSPGIRIVGNRIYDSSNGVTCHQCRQKTLDFAVSCKNVRNGKPCTIKFCHKCLLNRYGEKAEEVEQLGDWKCPKCRDFCNCSFCMKRRGQNPTGQLVKTAKASGFQSVCDMLSMKAPESLGVDQDNVMTGADNSSIDKEIVVYVPREPGKENNGLKPELVKAHKASPEKKSKKTKREGLKEISNGNSNDNFDKKKRVKRPKIADDGISAQQDGPIILISGDFKSQRSIPQASNSETNVNNNLDIPVPPEEAIWASHVDVPLPSGTLLTQIWDIEFLPTDVGNVFQFLEFCRRFGEILDVKEGEAESILRELVSLHTLRRGQNTLIVKFHIRVLTLILADPGIGSPSLTTGRGKNSWLKALEDLISGSELVLLQGFPLDWLEEGIGGYHDLDASKKLSLLIFLCDQVLCTEKFRSYIDDANLVFAEEKKRVKSKVSAAKEKEKN